MKHNFGEKTGTCPICTINLWDSCNGEPAIWPCGVKDCPYETPEQQAKIAQKVEQSEHGSGLSLLLEQMS